MVALQVMRTFAMWGLGLLMACTPSPADERVMARVRTAPGSGDDVTRLELSLTRAGRTSSQVVEANGAPLVFPVESELWVRGGHEPLEALAKAFDAAGAQVDFARATVASDELVVELALGRPSPPGPVQAEPAWQLVPPTVLGARSTAVTVTLENIGVGEAPALAFELEGDVAEFDVDSGPCPGLTLMPGERCTVRVTFVPTVEGRRRLVVRGPQGLHFTVEGDARRETTLELVALGGGDADFELDGVPCAPPCRSTGASGRLVTVRAFPARGSVLAQWSAPECPGRTSTCVLSMAQTRLVSVTVDAFEVPLTVELEGPGTVQLDTGVLESVFTCSEPQCVRWFPVGREVTVRPVTTNAALLEVSGDCSERSFGGCPLTMDRARAVKVGFGAANRAWVTSTPVQVPTTFERADEICAAYKPSTVSAAHARAWFSVPGHPVAERFADAGGWSTTFNAPVAEDVATLLAGRQQRAIDADERNVRFGTSVTYATGTLTDGGVGATCANGAGLVTVGESSLSAGGFTEAGTAPCDVPQRLLCLETTGRATLLPRRPAFAKVFVTKRRFVPAVDFADGGAAAADAWCVAEARDAGSTVQRLRALLARPDADLASQRDLPMLTRRDGVTVWPGTMTVAPLAPPNQLADGTAYLGLAPVWLGGGDAGADETCEGWSGGGTGRATFAGRQGPGFEVGFPWPCDAGAHLLCTERMP